MSIYLYIHTYLYLYLYPSIYIHNSRFITCVARRNCCCFPMSVSKTFCSFMS